MSKLAETMAVHLRASDDEFVRAGFVREYRFHDTRKWRFDFAWPADKLALEIEGGTWVAGAHNRGKHFESDCEKYANAVILGWRVLRATTDQVRRGEALQWVEGAIAALRGK